VFVVLVSRFFLNLSAMEPMRLADPRCESVDSQVASVITVSDGRSISGHLQRVCSRSVHPASIHTSGANDLRQEQP